MGSNGLTSQDPCSVCGLELEVSAGQRPVCPRCLMMRLFDDGSVEDAVEPSLKSQTSGRLGGYELIEELGRGGMGVVYRARQVALGREVAVKILREARTSNSEDVRRFRLEAKAIARLRHPNLVTIHEVGEEAGQPFFAMELVHGASLDARIRQGVLGVREAAELVWKLAEAIQEAHRCGVVHRDLKPSNVLLREDGEPVVTDFGLARALDEDSSLTRTGQLLGTPGYLSPEQAVGRGEAGPRSDIYGLGAILYFLLTGRAPFIGETVGQILRHVVEEEPASVRLLNPNVPTDLASVCERCLRKSVEERYESAGSLAEDLRRFLRGDPTVARPMGRLERSVRWCRRKPMLAALGVSTFTMLVLVMVGSPVAVLRISGERNRALRAEAEARQRAYASDMKLAQWAIEADDLAGARSILDRHRPQPGSPDLRNWEWRHCWLRCRSEEVGRARLDPAAWVAASATTVGGPLTMFVADRTGRVARLEWAQDKDGWIRGSDFSGAASALNAMAVAPGGRWLASAGSDIRVSSGQPGAVDSWVLASIPAVSVAFSPDGRWLAASCLDGTFRVWETGGWRLATQWTASTGFGGEDHTCVAFSQDGSRLAAANRDHRISVCEVPSWQPLWHATNELDPVSVLAFSPDGRWLVSGAAWNDTTVKVWRASDGTLERVLSGHKGWVKSVAFSPDGAMLATGGGDQTVRLWDTGTWKRRHTYRGHVQEVRFLMFDGSGKRLISAGRDDVLEWDTQQKTDEMAIRMIRGVAGHDFMPTMAFSPKDGSLALITRQGSVKRFDGSTLEETGSIQELGTNVVTLCISPDGSILVAGSRDGTLSVWEDGTARLGLRIEAHPKDPSGNAEPAWLLRFVDNGRALVSSDCSSTIRKWDTRTWKEIEMPKFPFEPSRGWYRPALEISPDERELLVGNGNGVLSRHDLDGFRPLAASQADDAWIFKMSFSQDGKRLLTVGSGVRIWHWPLSESAAAIEWHPRTVNGAVLSRDNSRVFGVGRGREALVIFDADRGSELFSLFDDTELFWPLLSPDEELLAAFRHPDALYVWRAPSLGEIDRAGSW